MITSVKKENIIDGNMGIDEILNLLGKANDETYGKLNMILFSLQAKGIIVFNEDKLDKEYNSSPI